MTEHYSIDFAWQQISAEQMVRAGYLGGAFRYISHDASKDLTPVEIENDHGAALPVFAMFESTAGRSREGKQAGRDDGNFHNDRLVHLGFPITACRCTTTDFDGGDECIPYYEGWAEANRDLSRGSYASGYLLRRLKQLGLIDIGWQTLSTGFRESTPVNRKFVDILQRFPTRDMPPHPRDTWDENVIYIDDWGAWMPPGTGGDDLKPEEAKMLKDVHDALFTDLDASGKPVAAKEIGPLIASIRDTRDKMRKVAPLIDKIAAWVDAHP